MKFQLSGRRRDYASDYFFYKAVYYNNPIIAQKGYDAETFANQAAAYATTFEADAEKAVQLISNTTTFTPYAERAADNFIKAAKQFGTWKYIYSLKRDEKGHYAGFDREALHWDEDRDGYVYLGKYLITFENSPQGMTIQKLTDYKPAENVSLEEYKRKKAAKRKPKKSKKKTTTRKRR